MSPRFRSVAAFTLFLSMVAGSARAGTAQWEFNGSLASSTGQLALTPTGYPGVAGAPGVTSAPVSETALALSLSGRIKPAGSSAVGSASVTQVAPVGVETNQTFPSRPSPLVVSGMVCSTAAKPDT